MQFGYMPGKGTIDAIIILRRIHSKHRKLYTCFVDLEKALDTVLMKVMKWAMKGNELQKHWLEQ